MTIDVTALKARTDLLALIGNDTRLKHVASTNGGEWAGPCPFCGGKDRFRVWPEQDGGGGFWCRQCKAQGDAIAYLQKRDNLTFAEACERLGGGKVAPGARLSQGTSSSPAPGPMYAETEPPSAVWQARACEFVAYAQGQLWQTPDALAYLRDRGLSDDTIRAAGLGYNPKEMKGSVRRWDAEGVYVWLPRGWVIPCESADVLWYVKVRRHPDDLAAAAGSAIAAAAMRLPSKMPAKYQTLKGGHLTMYGLETLASDRYTDCIICEGEFDALLLRQHVGSLVGCVALGSANMNLDMQAIDQLVAIRRVWVAYDDDEAGRAGAEKLLAASARIHLLPVPAHDVTDAWKAGHDLVAWVLPAIGPKRTERRLMWLKYLLDKLKDRADADDAVWRVWNGLLAEYDQMILSLGPRTQPMLLRIEERLASWNARFHSRGEA